MHQTIFILGRVPELSALEIKEVLSAEGIPVRSLSYARRSLCATTDAPLDCRMLIDRLGGTVKIGELLSLPARAKNPAELPPILADAIERLTEGTVGRITFGLSDYSDTLGRKNIQSLGLAIKKELKGRGRSARFVMSAAGEPALSSVVVEKQGLLESGGVELLHIDTDVGVSLARTIAVQPFEDFSRRDWERPAKSMNVGMLPPKIARMMVNCAGIPTNSPHILLDPFCGLGTLLQEALLAGFARVEGGDISEKNCAAARNNLSWLSQEKNIPASRSRVRKLDCRTLSSAFAPASIGAIVTEPYLGPVVRQSGIKNLAAVKKELMALYRSFLDQAHRVLKKNGRVVVVFPVWIRGKEKIALPIVEKILPAGFTVLCGPILIARPSQHVARELFVLEKR